MLENLCVTAEAHNWIHTAAPDYQYDAAGNMTYDATASLSYIFDQENRLTGAGGYTYTYDSDGNRVRKSNTTTGTLYWYMTPGIVAESDLAGNTTSEYVFFGGERVARRDVTITGLAGSTPIYGTAGIFYYFSDHLKTASVITDAAGNIKAESDYYPWGGELQFTNSDSNHYKFTGKERDAETGLDYFGARYFSNGLGRFLVPDWAGKPITVPYANFGNPQSLNLYSYVVNNPMTLNDPDGHEAGYTYNHDGTMTAPTEATTDGHPIRDTVALGVGTAASLAAPGSGTLIRNLFGLGLATAPVTGPIVSNVIEGATPGAPSLMGAFGMGKVEQVFEGFSVGRLANGAEIAAKISTTGENTTVSVLGAFNEGGPKSVAGTLSAIEKGAEAVAQKTGASEVTIQAVAVTNEKLAKFLTKQGFTKTVIQVGKEKVDAFQKTFKMKRTGE